jgi:hypothetical protein
MYVQNTTENSISSNWWFFAKLTELSNKNKDWLDRNQDILSVPVERHVYLRSVISVGYTIKLKDAGIV